MALPPALTELADTYPLPSNATFKGGITKLLNYVLGLLGSLGTPADARDTLGIGSTISFRNLIINGRFKVNQRAVSGTVTLAAGIYGHDRWKAGSGGCTYTFATSGGVTTITITSGSLVQVIEDQNIIGSTYTVSRTGTAQGRIVGGTYAAAPFQITGVTGGASLSVEFGAGTLTNVQVEPGSAVTPAEVRPIAVELAMCKRYGQPLEAGFIGPVVSGTPYGSVVEYPAQMRTTPTITGVTDITSSNFGGSTTFTPVSETSFYCSKTANATNNGIFISRAFASAEL